MPPAEPRDSSRPFGSIDELLDWSERHVEIASPGNQDPEETFSQDDQPEAGSDGE